MKNTRQSALLNLIKNNVIDTQEKLQQELRELGFNVTQATVSRDIKALNIIKGLDAEGNYRYRVHETPRGDNQDRYIEIFKRSTLSIKSAMNDVIVKCYSGTASAACAAIDHMYSEMTVGTLAGDDTILIITQDSETARVLVDTLNSIINS